MRKTFIAAAAVLASIVAGAFPVEAHHSFAAEFDITKIGRAHV